ncbi:hypothetical protein RFI_06550 [Reticulomyxa filosa]|uniref:Uncharacterized protein n=1 Tax=Reticulomyxa filosa TaxID=46433 RepID=X6NX35_RETFI|nr:hypothetical protein RFI_06550 [Reticulomyxa filosa]|eukprot:ETO30571.1 hypothetical protein RFI_06550 [Reticulomyxa filosa]
MHDQNMRQLTEKLKFQEQVNGVVYETNNRFSKKKKNFLSVKRKNNLIEKEIKRLSIAIEEYKINEQNQENQMQLLKKQNQAIEKEMKQSKQLMEKQINHLDEEKKQISTELLSVQQKIELMQIDHNKVNQQPNKTYLFFPPSKRQQMIAKKTNKVFDWSDAIREMTIQKKEEVDKLAKELVLSQQKSQSSEGDMSVLKQQLELSQESIQVLCSTTTRTDK